MGLISGLKRNGGTIKAIRFNDYRIVRAYVGERLIFDHYTYDLNIQSSVLMDYFAQMIKADDKKAFKMTKDFKFQSSQKLLNIEKNYSLKSSMSLINKSELYFETKKYISNTNFNPSYKININNDQKKHINIKQTLNLKPQSNFTLNNKNINIIQNLDLKSQSSFILNNKNINIVQNLDLINPKIEFSLSNKSIKSIQPLNFYNKINVTNDNRNIKTLAKINFNLNSSITSNNNIKLKYKYSLYLFNKNKLYKECINLNYINIINFHTYFNFSSLKKYQWVVDSNISFSHISNFILDNKNIQQKLYLDFKTKSNFALKNKNIVSKEKINFKINSNFTLQNKNIQEIQNLKFKINSQLSNLESKNIVNNNKIDFKINTKFTLESKNIFNKSNFGFKINTNFTLKNQNIVNNNKINFKTNTNFTLQNKNISNNNEINFKINTNFTLQNKNIKTLAKISFNLKSSFTTNNDNLEQKYTLFLFDKVKLYKKHIDLNYVNNVNFYTYFNFSSLKKYKWTVDSNIIINNYNNISSKRCKNFIFNNNVILLKSTAKLGNKTLLLHINSNTSFSYISNFTLNNKNIVSNNKFNFKLNSKFSLENTHIKQKLNLDDFKLNSKFSLKNIHIKQKLNLDFEKYLNLNLVNNLPLKEENKLQFYSNVFFIKENIPFQVNNKMDMLVTPLELITTKSKKFGAVKQPLNFNIINSSIYKKINKLKNNNNINLHEHTSFYTNIEKNIHQKNNLPIIHKIDMSSLNITDTTIDMSLNLNYYINIINSPKIIPALKDTIKISPYAIFNVKALILDSTDNIIDFYNINRLNSASSSSVAEKMITNIDSKKAKLDLKLDNFFSSLLAMNINNNVKLIKNNPINLNATLTKSISLIPAGKITNPDIDLYLNKNISIHGTKIAIFNEEGPKLNIKRVINLNHKINLQAITPDYFGLRTNSNILISGDSCKISTEILELQTNINTSIQTNTKINNDTKDMRVNQFFEITPYIKSNMPWREISFKVNEFLMIKPEMKNINIWLCPIQDGDTLYIRQGYEITQSDINTLEVK